jgi:LacI family transcriptional regulator
MKMQSKELTGVREIARRANVSIGTVDRVIHNRKGVSVQTREKINAIIEELNFQPNKMASLLASKKNVRLAVCIPRTSTETDYWKYPLNGAMQAEAELERFGVNFSYFFYDLDSEKSFVNAGKLLLKSGPDGILLAPSFVEESLLLMGKIKKKGVPVVFINADLPKAESLSYIGPELYQSGRLAAQLISLSAPPAGHVLVVNISTNFEEDHHLKRKEQGFRQFFEETATAHEIHTLHIGKTKSNSVESALLDVLTNDPAIKAIFVTNSRVSVVAKILQKHHRQIFLIGYDFLRENLHYLETGHIACLICQRPQEQGYVGAMALYKHLFKLGEPDKTVYMPIDIITRENYKFYKS